jgi:hypothetical protein
MDISFLLIPQQRMEECVNQIRMGYFIGRIEQGYQKFLNLWKTFVGHGFNV